MKSTTLMDLGRHAGNKAVEAVDVVAQLVDDSDERVVLQTYAAGQMCAALVASAIGATWLQNPTKPVIDEAFVRGVMAEVTALVVRGVLLGEKMLAEGSAVARTGEA
jgi:hypothetical protein